jgi:hypothetical protein
MTWNESLPTGAAMLIVHDTVPFVIVQGEFAPPTFTSVNMKGVGATPFTVRTKSATDCVLAEKYDCVERVLWAERAVDIVPVATLRLRLTVTVPVGLAEELGVGVAAADATGFGVGLGSLRLGGVLPLPPHAVSAAADANAPRQKAIEYRTLTPRLRIEPREIIDGRLT